MRPRGCRRSFLRNRRAPERRRTIRSSIADPGYTSGRSLHSSRSCFVYRYSWPRTPLGRSGRSSSRNRSNTPNPLGRRFHKRRSFEDHRGYPHSPTGTRAGRRCTRTGRSRSPARRRRDCRKLHSATSWTRRPCTRRSRAYHPHKEGPFQEAHPARNKQAQPGRPLQQQAGSARLTCERETRALADKRMKRVASAAGSQVCVDLYEERARYSCTTQIAVSPATLRTSAANEPKLRREPLPAETCTGGIT